MLRLRYDTPSDWLAAVEADPIAFLQDHASNEHRVSRAAMSLAVQHPEHRELVDAMVDVSLEELEHFKLVYELLKDRGASLGHGTPDVYMRAIRKELSSSDRDEWLLRRLVLFGVVEARGCERFALVGEGSSDPELRAAYTELARSEARHHALYFRLAKIYFDDARVDSMTERVLELEADCIRVRPIRAALH